MPAILIVCKFFLLFTDLSIQSRELDTGIYMVMNDTKICEKRITNIDKTIKLCVTPEPIIPIDDFISLSNIRVLNPENSNFDLTLSAAGIGKIKDLHTQLPNAKLVLVVDHVVVGYVNNLDVIRNKSLLIEGEERHISAIHEKFRTILANKQH